VEEGYKRWWWVKGESLTLPSTFTLHSRLKNQRPSLQESSPAKAFNMLFNRQCSPPSSPTASNTAMGTPYPPPPFHPTATIAYKMSPSTSPSAPICFCDNPIVYVMHPHLLLSRHSFLIARFA